jgi:hypothetical protein
VHVIIGARFGLVLETLVHQEQRIRSAVGAVSLRPIVLVVTCEGGLGRRSALGEQIGAAVSVLNVSTVGDGRVRRAWVRVVKVAVEVQVLIRVGDVLPNCLKVLND